MRRRQFIALIGGVVVTWPLAARMQRAHAQRPAKVYRIAIVAASAPVVAMNEAGRSGYAAFFKELRRLGYIEGQNLVVERYSGEGRSEHYAELAREVVRLKPDLVFALARAVVQSFQAATATIPIVGVTGDPIGQGVVSSLAHPGGNITGVSLDAGIEIWGKRVQLLKEVSPKLTRVGFLHWQPGWEGSYGLQLQDVARQMGFTLLGPPLNGAFQEAEYRRVLTAMVQDSVDALVVSDLEENFTYGRLIVEIADKYRLATIYPNRYFAELGGLITYGVDTSDLFRRAANEVDEILKGAKPGDIPFYQATKFELVINLKTAKALGLSVPPSLLARADEVFE